MYRCVLLLIIIGLSCADILAVDLEYRDLLISRAKSLELYKDPQWHALLHYQKNSLSGTESLAKGDQFFVSREGKTDPEKEMVETIASFFRDDGRKLGDDDIQPYPCAFIARYTWLSDKLQIEESRLPSFNCTDFKEWYGLLAPDSASLVFPSSFLNNPASAFGHTLLRINQADQDEKSRLLAYAVHFSANTAGDAGVLFALRGVFGSYPGYFSVAPYYEKVKKYSDIEKRDIWEYPLNLTKAELRLMLMHVWELRGIPFSYYYFDENCSYHLLALLDVARPALQLMKDFRSWVIPVDTLRAVAEKGVIEEGKVFRPSMVSKFQARIDASPKTDRAKAKAIVDQHQPYKGESANALDLAYEYLNLKLATGKLTGKEEEKRAFGILTERSRDLTEPLNAEVPVPDASPEEGHRTMKAGLAAGIESDKLFYEARFRPAYHDLLDPGAGYLRGSQIEVLDTVFRQREEESFRLNKLQIVNALSLSPRNEFISPLSWNLDFGFERADFRRDPDILIFALNGGAGRMWLLSESAYLYSLIDMVSEYSANFDENYALGAGSKSGVIADLTEGWKLEARIKADQFFLGEEHSSVTFTLEQRVSLGKDTAIRLETSERRRFGDRDFLASLAFEYYL